ncbi:MAG TPA: hypothetical protein VN827_00175 [Chthoniobacterales bacterium]|nr:hypothetical protein [Chthoniobacterales bacterium]
MITRIMVSTVTSLVVASIAFSQMKYSRANSQRPTPTPTPTSQQKIVPASAQIPAKQSPTPPQRAMQAAAQYQPKQMPPTRTLAASVQPKATPTPAPTVAKPTPTPVPPPDVKAYLDRQIANSKDKKFHMTVNGKDLALTPFHVWAQKSTGADSTSTCIDMKSDDGRIYDIDFVTTGLQVTGVKIHKINGESLR